MSSRCLRSSLHISTRIVLNSLLATVLYAPCGLLSPSLGAPGSEVVRSWASGGSSLPENLLCLRLHASLTALLRYSPLPLPSRWSAGRPGGGAPARPAGRARDEREKRPNTPLCCRHTAARAPAPPLPPRKNPRPGSFVPLKHETSVCQRRATTIGSVCSCHKHPDCKTELVEAEAVFGDTFPPTNPLLPSAYRTGVPTRKPGTQPCSAAAKRRAAPLGARRGPSVCPVPRTDGCAAPGAAPRRGCCRAGRSRQGACPARRGSKRRRGGMKSGWRDVDRASAAGRFPCSPILDTGPERLGDLDEHQLVPPVHALDAISP
ncbi:uncharacterized protein LOC121365316 [Pyrgilauda ruficollis]|uniref:uncharacterized protein LOC121365316 n=1 Tax=Pyrgilauda ruficollis TaxID=221976 RepID=UPI001B875088|nr:uncharacterized protein LOC121365316 [Pyrgilauda ruficollis]